MMPGVHTDLNPNAVQSPTVNEDIARADHLVCAFTKLKALKLHAVGLQELKYFYDKQPAVLRVTTRQTVNLKNQQKINNILNQMYPRIIIKYHLENSFLQKAATFLNRKSRLILQGSLYSLTGTTLLNVVTNRNLDLKASLLFSLGSGVLFSGTKSFIEANALHVQELMHLGNGLLVSAIASSHVICGVFANDVLDAVVGTSLATEDAAMAAFLGSHAVQFANSLRDIA